MALYNYVETTGVIVPDTGTLLDDVQGEFKAALGQDVVVTPESPQGVLITAETLARDSVVRNNANVANQINPNLSGGLFLDALCALTGLNRAASTKSTFATPVNVTGVAGTIIPAGSIATTGTDDFETISSVTIGAGGTATVYFQSVEYGAIPCAIGALNTIVSGVIGWETVNNTVAATLGTDQQSDLSLRALRKNTLALQGLSQAETITSGLYAVAGVKSLQFRENRDAATQIIDGVTMAAHSIWACIDGGLDADIAQVLLKKVGGAGYNGPVSVTVTESASQQNYTVKFQRPTDVPILARITAKVTSAIQNPHDAIVNALLAYANNEIEGETGLTVGKSVSPFEIAGAINIQTPGIYVQLVEVTKAAVVSYQSTEIPLNIWEKATLASGSITVIIV